MTKIIAFMAAVLLLAVAAAAQDYPRAETFVGYTYMRGWPSGNNVPSFSANGGGGQFVYNFGRWIGAVADVGAVHNGSIGGYNLDSTFTNFLFGPRIPIRVHSRVTPYFQTLFGGVHASTSARVNAPGEGVIIPPPIAVPRIVVPSNDAVALRAAASQTAFAMAIGGGLDIKLSKVVSFRPIGLDYFMTRLQNLRTMNDNNQHNLRYTAGLNFTFGGEAPAPPPPPAPKLTTCWDGSSVTAGTPCPKRDMTVRLAGAQNTVCAGTPVSIATAGELPEGTTLEWTVNGQPAGQGSAFEFATAGKEPGTYNIGVTGSASEYNNASAETSITILPYRAPTGSLQVSPPEIWVGEQALITPTFVAGQCGGPLGDPALSATEGSIRDRRYDSSGIQFDASDTSEQRKTVRLLARASDGKSEATAEATVVVKRKAALMATRFPDVVFPEGSARVNNCGKRVLLEELKPFIEKDPTGKVVLVGHLTENETKRGNLDQQRALNAAAVLSAGQGVCSRFPASQIVVSATGTASHGVDLRPNFCGTSTTPGTGERYGQAVRESDEQAKYRRVEVWFVPTGGTVPASLQTQQDAAALGVSSLGCPK
jgi:outer membrane protein OmpA-like peptidoglycan-associated protein